MSKKDSLLEVSNALAVAMSSIESKQKKIDQLEHELKMHKKLASDYYPLNEFIQKRSTKVGQLGKNYGDVAIEEIQELEELLKEATYSMADTQGFYKRMESYNNDAFASIENFRNKPEIIKILEKV